MNIGNIWLASTSHHQACLNTHLAAPGGKLGEGVRTTQRNKHGPSWTQDYGVHMRPPMLGSGESINLSGEVVSCAYSW